MSVEERFNLTKAQQTLDRFLLDKGVHTAPTLRVATALDISGSMNGIIRRGDLQRSLNQLVPVGLKFDDNGQVDVFKFDDRCDHVGTMDRTNYENYVAKNGISARGGTCYAPVVRSALEFFFKPKGFFNRKVDNTPALVQIITDGDCSDARQAEQAMIESQAYPIYWQFVAVGNASFPTIKYLADKYPNVGDVYLRDFGLSEEEVYGQVVSTELVDWIKRF